MIIFRARNPKAIDLVEDKLIEERDLDKKDIARMFGDFMIAFPEKALFILLMNDEEVKAFVMAYIPEGRKHLFLLQAWASPDVKGGSELIFSRVRAFAEENNLDEIRAETMRSPGPILRKWKFETYSHVLIYKLKNENEREEKWV